jgi:hypothetical protein
MPIVSYAHPAAEVIGIIHAPHGGRDLTTYTNPHAGQIAAPAVTPPDAPTPMEQILMDIHVLTGPKHSEAGQVTGTFLKATGPAAFGFVPHGLTAPDVGALPVAGQAADSDKVDGQHASAFLPINATADAALDSDKLDGKHATEFLAVAGQAADSDKLDGSHAAAFAAATHYHSALAASDLTPNPALSIDANAVCSIISPDTTKSLALKHDNSNAHITTNGGSLLLKNIAADSPALITIQGTGDGNASYSQIRMDDRAASPAYLRVGIYARAPFIDSNGTSKAAMQLQSDGTLDLKCFNGAASGYTPALKISGYRAADSLRTLAIAVGSEATDTASISGLTNYKFTGSMNATANLQTAGATRIDAAGNATLATTTTAPLTCKAAAEGGSPQDIQTTSAIMGAGQEISLKTYQSAIRTTSAVEHVLLAVPIPTGTTATVEATVTAVKSDNAHAAGYKFVATFRNVAGTLYLVGSLSTPYLERTDANWLATLSASSQGEAQIKITGVAITIINWFVTATRHIAYPTIP